ncbi:HAD-IA family hydrolase [Streptomyces sp. NA04227]|uniref:HAD family hydrolase n=1 Tax=Streptomyces sp. NA04227 TaxID=2742136 RepID=UPI0015911F08|nr:HAD-IA family hydrolase [Streptomyces sp. NA04227]QKW05147.1 HAD-IA family hydrolase [Streptomyces sp. NA04227]
MASWSRLPAGVDAVVLDTDGVLTDSAGLHAAAWRTAFDACLRAAGDERPFDADAEYRRYVDGRSRRDGARAFLRSRGLRLPEGSADEPPGTGSVAAVCARKEEEFLARLRVRTVPEVPGAGRLLRALAERDVPCAAISASRHATDLLRSAGLLGLLRLVVDGNEARRLDLPGKPDPALFLEAARRLGVPPERAAVVEDALAGVAAGRRGGFALVVGVDRTPGGTATEELRTHGADVVVPGPAALLGIHDAWHTYGHEQRAAAGDTRGDRGGEG